MTTFPKSSHERQRWDSTKQMRRILEGTTNWRGDIARHMAAHLDPARQEAWGPPMTGINLYKSTVLQLSRLYDKTPIVSHPAFDSNPTNQAYLDSLSLWQQSQQHLIYVMGLRESLIHISYSPPPPGRPLESPINLRLVTPDEVVITPLSTNSSIPGRVQEAVTRTDLSGKPRDVWDVWDITDPSAPSYRVLDPSKPRHDGSPSDVTGEFMADPNQPYPYIDPTSQAPFLPYVLYHAQDTGKMWGYDYWSELVDATLDVALLTTFWKHVVKEASWQQKYGIDVELQGQSIVDSGTATRTRVPTDPASILLFRTMSDRGGSLSSFATPTDPQGVLASINDYIQMTLTSLGIERAQIESSQSGVAIQLRRESVRAMQAKIEPNMRLGDQELLNKVAMISNLMGPSGTPILPTETSTGQPYSIDYPSLPYSREEMSDRLNAQREQMALGLLSPIDVYMEMNPNTTREQAAQAIADNLRFNALLSAPTTTTEGF
jgi:hypothetical protein